MYSRMVTTIPNDVRRQRDGEIPLPSLTADGKKHFHELRLSNAKLDGST